MDGSISRSIHFPAVKYSLKKSLEQILFCDMHIDKYSNL